MSTTNHEAINRLVEKRKEVETHEAEIARLSAIPPRYTCEGMASLELSVVITQKLLERAKQAYLRQLDIEADQQIADFDKWDEDQRSEAEASATLEAAFAAAPEPDFMFHSKKVLQEQKEKLAEQFRTGDRDLKVDDWKGNVSAKAAKQRSDAAMDAIERGL